MIDNYAEKYVLSVTCMVIFDRKCVIISYPAEICKQKVASWRHAAYILAIYVLRPGILKTVEQSYDS